jgi:hypothetical protein
VGTTYPRDRRWLQFDVPIRRVVLELLFVHHDGVMARTTRRVSEVERESVPVARSSASNKSSCVPLMAVLLYRLHVREI